jgi:inner membrane protein
MPSPIGHALAGIAVAWTADIVSPLVSRGQTRAVSTASAPLKRCPTTATSTPTLVATCAILAALPDVDLVLPGFHRTATHSVTAVLIVTIIAAAVTGRVTRWRTALVCGAAYASHLLLDWLGADQFPPYGIELFWPFSDRWYISGWDVFRQTARLHFFAPEIIRQNVHAVGQEGAILAPVLLVLWLIRVKTLTRLAPELTRGDHAAQ